MKAVFAGVVAGHERAVETQPRRRLRTASAPFQPDGLIDVRADAADVDARAERASVSGAQVGHDLHARYPACRICRCDVYRTEVVGCGQHVAGDELFVNGSFEVGAQAGSEHSHERHQREPDHQRRGRRRRARGVADRVGARERTGGTSDSLCRPSEPACELRHEAGREHRHATEQQRRSDPDREQPRSRRDGAEQAEQHQPCRGAERCQSGIDAETRQPCGRQHRSLADGRYRRHPRRTQRRTQCRQERYQHAYH